MFITCSRSEVRRRPRRADRCHAQLRLRGARLVDDHHARRDRRRRGQCRTRGSAVLPLSERLLGQCVEVGHRNVARHHKRRIVRDEVLLPERHMSSREIALTDASVPISLYPYGCFVAIERHGGDLRRDLRRVVAHLRELSRARVPADARLLPPGMTDERDVGHQIEQRAEVLAQRAARNVSSRPSSCRFPASRRAARSDRQAAARFASRSPRRASRR